MGPCILLDKSAFQSLSRRELLFLEKHYYANIPPVLIIEILADLKKFDSRERSKAKVAELAEKLPSGESMINVHYRDVACGNLLGYRFPMDGRPVVLGGERFPDDDGNLCEFMDEQPERAALRRWREGVYTGTEELLASPCTQRGAS